MSDSFIEPDNVVLAQIFKSIEDGIKEKPGKEMTVANLGAKIIWSKKSYGPLLHFLTKHFSQKLTIKQKNDGRNTVSLPSAETDDFPETEIGVVKLITEVLRQKGNMPLSSLGAFISWPSAGKKRFGQLKRILFAFSDVFILSQSFGGTGHEFVSLNANGANKLFNSDDTTEDSDCGSLVSPITPPDLMIREQKLGSNLSKSQNGNEETMVDSSITTENIESSSTQPQDLSEDQQKVIKPDEDEIEKEKRRKKLDAVTRKREKEEKQGEWSTRWTQAVRRMNATRRKVQSELPKSMVPSTTSNSAEFGTSVVGGNGSVQVSKTIENKSFMEQLREHQQQKQKQLEIENRNDTLDGGSLLASQSISVNNNDNKNYNNNNNNNMNQVTNPIDQSVLNSGWLIARKRFIEEVFTFGKLQVIGSYIKRIPEAILKGNRKEMEISISEKIEFMKMGVLLEERGIGKWESSMLAAAKPLLPDNMESSQGNGNLEEKFRIADGEQQQQQQQQEPSSTDSLVQKHHQQQYQPLGSSRQYPFGGLQFQQQQQQQQQQRYQPNLLDSDTQPSSGAQTQQYQQSMMYALLRKQQQQQLHQQQQQQLHQQHQHQHMLQQNPSISDTGASTSLHFQQHLQPPNHFVHFQQQQQQQRQHQSLPQFTVANAIKPTIQVSYGSRDVGSQHGSVSGGSVPQTSNHQHLNHSFPQFQQ
eukprot:TRINITY_DN268_c0_g1_i2.p1 TRINITY_DN268_c0_g1~~TRINITY_DN268_c0_g1_i2.p1  ORF type:complete len:700 (-),score=218.29 TRINITY_DN268_c0_g1_i2:90-2189(-)